MRRTGGFTLIEILISMSLFTLIGLAVVLLMKTGADLWLRGTEGTQQEDRLEMSLPRFAEDLRHLIVPRQVDRIPFDKENPDPDQQPDPLPPDNRFVSGYFTVKVRDQEIRCRYCAFVRDLEGLPEVETFASRAGTNPKGTAYIDGKNDDEEFKRSEHLPTGGQVEILWYWLPDLEQPGVTARPGVGSVYRAYRSPIGGSGSLLDPKNYDELAELDRLDAQPVFQNVLLFDLTFWTQYTTTWEEGVAVVAHTPQDASELKRGRPSCGPSLTWDSTRGLFAAEGAWGFKLARGEKSFRASNDDIWPRAVRVQFALVEEQTTLARGLGAGDNEFTVDTSAFATGRGELSRQLMKIGTEWLELIGRDAQRRDTFITARRGVRGTAAQAHAVGAPVYYGKVFDVTIPIPSFRDDNN